MMKRNINPDSEALLRQGFRLLRTNNYRSAGIFFREAVGLEPENRTIRYVVALGYMKAVNISAAKRITAELGNYEKAKQLRKRIEEVSKFDPLPEEIRTEKTKKRRQIDSFLVDKAYRERVTGIAQRVNLFKQDIAEALGIKRTTFSAMISGTNPLPEKVEQEVYSLLLRKGANKSEVEGLRKIAQKLKKE